jgi:hypothetical protein
MARAARDCADQAAAPLASSAIDRIIDMILNLEAVSHVQELGSNVTAGSD